MMLRHNWWFAQCLRQAQEWAPDVFGGVHPDTPRRWSFPGKTEDKDARERPTKIPPPVAQILATVVLD
eukprot:1107116-Amphidinium_carterae.1